ncbi:MAG: magnesium-dependent phosphatase-1 [Proteobacteria bacterium]|nr:magnesium-dependent phosphatase-1 [Pseudomonadota bacterium]
MGLVSRALWHVNRSPLRHAVKAGVNMWHLSEKRERMRQQSLLNVTPEEKAKAADLNRDGYAVVTELMDQGVLKEFSDAGQARLQGIAEAETKQTSTRKKFWVRLLDAEMRNGQLSADNVFVRYALQPSVINVIATALGEVPWLDYVLLSYSRHTGEDLQSSQLWHRDHDDVRVVKLFSYLTDVETDDDGPFTFLPRQATDKFGYPLLGSHFPDAEVFEKVSRSDVKVVRAPRLASFMVDTAKCLHMGSRMAPGHGRLLYTATYFAFPRIYPGGKKRPFSPAASTTTLQKMVMGL